MLLSLKLFKSGNSYNLRLPIDVARQFIGAEEIEVEIKGAVENKIPENYKPEEEKHAAPHIPKKEILDKLRGAISAIESKPPEPVQFDAPKKYQAYDPRYNPDMGYEEEVIEMEN